MVSWEQLLEVKRQQAEILRWLRVDGAHLHFVAQFRSCFLGCGSSAGVFAVVAANVDRFGAHFLFFRFLSWGFTQMWSSSSASSWRCSRSHSA